MLFVAAWISFSRTEIVDDEIAADGHGCHGGHMRNRATALVGRDFDSIRFGQTGDFADIRDAARMHDVGLDDCGAFRVEQLFEFEAGEETFAGGDGDGAFRRYLAEAFRIFAKRRFFEKQGPVWGDGGCELDRRANRKCFGGLERDIGVISEDFPDGFEFGDALPDSL